MLAQKLMSNLKQICHIGFMKRFTTLAIILILGLLSSFSYGQLLVGVRGGYSASGILFTPERDTKPLIDPLLDGGIVLKLFNNEHVGFQGEANFTQRGYISYSDSVTIYKRVNSYFEIPIFFQVREAKNNFFAHINVGFYASGLVNSKAGQGPDSTKINLLEYTPNILRDNFFDYGLRGGVGAGYDFNWGTVQLDIAYSYGFGDLYYYNYSDNPSRSPAWIVNGSISFFINLSKPKKTKTILDEETQISKVINLK